MSTDTITPTIEITEIVDAYLAALNETDPAKPSCDCWSAGLPKPAGRPTHFGLSGSSTSGATLVDVRTWTTNLEQSSQRMRRPWHDGGSTLA